MSQALKSERAQKTPAAPDKARQAPAEARTAVADGPLPLPLQTILYLQKFAGNAAIAEVLEATTGRKPPERAEAPESPAKPPPGAAPAPVESALVALPTAAIGLASGAAGAVGSLLGGLIGPAPAPAPAKGNARPPAEHPAPAAAGKPESKADAEQKSGPEQAADQTGAAAGEAAATTAAPPTPDTDPNFQAVKGRVHGTAGQSKAHAPAHTKVAEAHGAAVGPPNQVASQAGAAQVEKMAGQQPGGFDKQAFMAAVRKAIDASAPQTLEEADNFKESGKAAQVQGQVSGLVGQNKQQAEGAIKGAAEAAPDTSAAQPKPVTPMPAEQPGAPPANVGAASAMPPAKSKEEVSLAKGPAEVHASMAEAEVTEPQLKESNEPEFAGALEAKQTAEQHSEQAPAAFRKEEQGVLDKAKGSATASATQGLEAMHGSRAKALTAVGGGKDQAKSQDEARRAEVSSKIEGIYGKTKDEVTAILNGIDPQVDTAFKSGEEKARAAFESYVDTRMSAYKDDRYSGLRGKWRWVKDKFAGLPSEVNQFYVQGRELYLSRMEGVIGGVADIVGRELTRAKERIALGQTQIQEYVHTLPADLQKVGKEAQQTIQAKFDELTQTVDSKQDDLVNDLAKKYVESRDAVDSRIKEMKDANKGLIDRAKDAVMGVINTIRKLKDMLLGVLAKVASVVGTIISAPIKFLGNLVSGIKLGLTNFMSNIGEHLKKGLMGWLFGALGEAGLQLPEKFDLKGILSIIMQVLGLTYGHIRGLAAGIVGEEMIGHLEKSLGFFQILIKEGPAGLWKWVVEKIGELKETVMVKIKEFIQEKVIIAGIMWLIGLLNPVAAFIKACKAIYDIVMFFVDRATQVAELVNAIVDSVGAIAGGALGEAAGKVENALAKGIPVAIGFLASLLGLGGISDKIKSIIHAIQEPIHNIISKVLGVVLKPFKWIGNKIKQGAAWAKKKVQQGVAFVKEKAKAGVARVRGFLGRAGEAIFGPKVPFDGAGESHELWAEQAGDGLALKMASKNPQFMDAKLRFYKERARTLKGDERDQVDTWVSDIQDYNRQVKALKPDANGEVPGLAALEKQVAAIASKVEKALGIKTSEAVLHMRAPEVVERAKGSGEYDKAEQKLIESGWNAKKSALRSAAGGSGTVDGEGLKWRPGTEDVRVKADQARAHRKEWKEGYVEAVKRGTYEGVAEVKEIWKREDGSIVRTKDGKPMYRTVKKVIVDGEKKDVVQGILQADHKVDLVVNGLPTELHMIHAEVNGEAGSNLYQAGLEIGLTEKDAGWKIKKIEFIE